MMITVTCIDLSCGVVFGIPDHIESQARRYSDRRIICPNGHPFVYTDSEPDRLRKKIENLEKNARSYEESTKTRNEQVTRLLKTISYWRGIAHRKRKT